MVDYNFLFVFGVFKRMPAISQQGKVLTYKETVFMLCGKKRDG
jgi:hypothetical protein